VASAIAADLRALDSAHARYVKHLGAGRILPNSVEALRVELTDHSNGRTARLLMNLHLLNRGYPLTIIEVERRSEYLAALEDANAGNTTAFASFIVRTAERSIIRLIGSD
jgi:hypothetical protein